MSRPLKIHELKSWPHLFAPIAFGQKQHELRHADRNFQVGDHIWLREYDPKTEKYLGREILAKITYITDSNNPCALSDNGLNDGFCILSIEVVLQ